MSVLFNFLNRFHAKYVISCSLFPRELDGRSISNLYRFCPLIEISGSPMQLFLSKNQFCNVPLRAMCVCPDHNLFLSTFSSCRKNKMFISSHPSITNNISIHKISLNKLCFDGNTRSWTWLRNTQLNGRILNITMSVYETSISCPDVESITSIYI